MVEGKTGAGAQSERASHPAAHAPHTSLTSRTSRPLPRLAAPRGLSRPLCLSQCPSLDEFLLAFLPSDCPSGWNLPRYHLESFLPYPPRKIFPLCSRSLPLFHLKTPLLPSGLERVMITLKAGTSQSMAKLVVYLCEVGGGRATRVQRVSRDLPKVTRGV